MTRLKFIVLDALKLNVSILLGDMLNSFDISGPYSKNYEHYNHEELLNQLEEALKDNEGLVQQLASKYTFLLETTKHSSNIYI